MRPERVQWLVIDCLNSYRKLWLNWPYGLQEVQIKSTWIVAGKYMKTTSEELKELRSLILVLDGGPPLQPIKSLLNHTFINIDIFEYATLACA